MGKRSPFGADWLPGLELFVDGAWLDVSADLGDDGLGIKRGRESEAGQIAPSSMTARLRNPTGRYSPRNPSSDLFGLIGRNTPVRAYVELGAPWLHLEGTNARATCPDSAALSITGDLDVRWEGRRDDWSTKTDLLSKYGAAGQRSWALQANADGTLSLYWSVAGTTLLSATSLVPLRASTRRVAVRATLDVNNGFGGYTVRFYTAPSLTGTWEQLGEAAAFTASGTTSIFDSTAVVTVGKNANTDAASSTVRVYGWEVRQGIDGTVRTSVTTSGLTLGASSFSDGTNTWTVASPAAVTNRHYRFYGEVSKWTPTWTAKGAEGAAAELECAGVMRRLNQGASPLRSPMYRACSAIGANLVAYWPMEDDGEATSVGAVVGRPMAVTGDVSFGGYSGFAASAPVLTVQSARLRAVVPSYTAAGALQVRWLGLIPTGTPNGSVLWTGSLSGTARTIVVTYLTASSGQIQVTLLDIDGALLGSAIVFSLAVTDARARFSVELVQDGSDIDVTASKYEVGASGGVSATGTVASATFGRLTALDVNAARASLGDVAIGHLTIEKAVTSLFDVSVSVIAGHEGEEADARVARLCAENGITATVVGAPASAAALGGQGVDTLPSLLAEAAEVDQGLLYEPRDGDGLAYRPLDALYSQHPALEIAHVDNLLRPFQPVDDDQGTRNRVTVAREGGSSFTAEVSEGPLSTQPAPDGVGVYDEQVTLSLAQDEQAEQQAGWRVHVGTHDEERWPVIGIALDDSVWLADAEGTRDVLALDLGDRLDVTDLPAWLPPDDVRALAQGYTERIEPLRYRIEVNCTPERPFHALFLNSTQRWSAAGTVTAGSLTTTATTFTVTPPAGVEWTHEDGDYLIVVGGEVMTVTDVVGGTDFTVVRSVNGVVRTHDAGAAVALYEPSFWAL